MFSNHQLRERWPCSHAWLSCVTEPRGMEIQGCHVVHACQRVCQLCRGLLRGNDVDAFLRFATRAAAFEAMCSSSAQNKAGRKSAPRFTAAMLNTNRTKVP